LLSAPTPRTADGKPDLTGVWNRAVPAPNAGPGGVRAFYLYDGEVPSQENEVQSAWAVRDADFYWLEIDQEIIVKSDRSNLPLYKPEFWEQVRHNEEYGYERALDPGFGCQEVGIVKRGFPAEIIQMPHKVLLRYGGARSAIREVVIGRPSRTEDQYEGMHILGGSTVGRWDGDTLVVETVDFPPEQVWYSTRGWPMSAEAKITERITRKGDVLTIETTVDDPAFIRPWVLPKAERQINPGALIPPAPTCVELDREHITGKRFGERSQ
jgi:hypothetical protein